MSVNDVFVLNPEAFFRQNVVIQTVPDDPPDDLYLDLTHRVLGVVVAETQAMVVNVDGGKVCSMRVARPGETPSLLAYWCPYKQNDFKEVMLGNEALYMFTPTMNGCTLGAGSYAGNGARKVMHINMARSGTAVSPDKPTSQARAQQRKMQKNILISELGRNVQMVSPDSYMLDTSGELTMQSTTFALHGLGQNWEFYTLTYRKLGTKTYLHGGVSRRI